jgi:ferritin
MLKTKIVEAVNVQINKELYSAYLYLAMSAQCESEGLKGFANWFQVQYREETGHAMKLYHYLLGQGEKVKLGAIEQPPAEFASPKAMFETTLKHEQFITKSIHDLVNLAIAEKDHATQIFLQWFVTEQIEEEANDNEILGKMKMVGDGPGLFWIDKELGSRAFSG